MSDAPHQFGDDDISASKWPAGDLELSAGGLAQIEECAELKRQLAEVRNWAEALRDHWDNVTHDRIGISPTYVLIRRLCNAAGVDDNTG